MTDPALSSAVIADMVRQLTPAMRLALRRRQRDLVEDRATVIGHGMTMRALRQRGLIEGAMPHAVLTRLGSAVVAADPAIDVDFSPILQ